MKTTSIISSILLLAATQGWAQNAPLAKIDPTIVQTLSKAGPNFSRTLVPLLRQGQAAVPAARVPSKTAGSVMGWASTILHPSLKPAQLKDRLIGMRRAPDNDVLAAAFSTSESRLVWLDLDGAVALFIDPTDKSRIRTSEEEIEEYLVESIQKHLRLPTTSDRPEVKMYAKKAATRPGRHLWYGSFLYNLPVAPDGKVLAPVAWHNYYTFWTDGNQLYLRMAATDGKPKVGTDNRKSARYEYRPRLGG